jgi:hypothetical protein
VQLSPSSIRPSAACAAESQICAAGASGLAGGEILGEGVDRTGLHGVMHGVPPKRERDNTHIFHVSNDELMMPRRDT